MIQHTVLLRFPQPLCDEDATEMHDIVSSWAGEITELKRLRLGPPNQPEHTDGYQYLLYLEVADMDALKALRRASGACGVRRVAC